MPETAVTDWGYCRVSSEEQARGQSIDGQFRRIRDSGIPPERIVTEVESATKGKTHGLFKLFQQAREGKVKSILAVRQDRFQRTRKVEAQMWELIDEHDVKFKFLDQTDIDKDDPTSTFQARVLGASAQFETELLTQRVKNGILENKLKKKHHGRSPWGYICKEGRLLPNEAVWDAARAVIECYLQTGSSTRARELKYELTGQAMGPSSFSRWLLSPNIRGAVVYNASKKDVPLEIFWGQHVALMQPHEWEAVQAIRAKNRTNTGAFRKKSVAPTIGTGLFKCNCCGKNMIKISNTKQSVAKYQCRTIRGSGCTQGYLNWVRLPEVANHIRRAINFAAFEIADSETPHEFPEPPELSSLKEERDTYLKMDTLRSTKMAEELTAEIEEMERVIRDQSDDRFAGVRSEFEKLTDWEVLMGMNDEELRSIALRYGLVMFVDKKNVVTYKWERLGSQPITLTMHFDNDRNEDGTRTIATVSKPDTKLTDEAKAYLLETLRS